MTGLHPQSKRKRDLRLADLSESPDLGPDWERPSDNDCEEIGYSLPCPGSDFGADRIMLRMVTHHVTSQLVEFAIIQLALHGGRWREVVIVDSCHGDVHLHRCGRRSEGRIGDPEVMLRITDAQDIQEGYGLAYDRVIDNWASNKERWNDA